MSRLDRALVERGLARSRSQAQELIARGAVQVNGAVAGRAGAEVDTADEISAETDRYVSRAAHKLLGALSDTGLRPAGRALDAGASTGGFTQVLLECGCAPVYAVDVGRDQLAPALRGDPRVRVRERTNVRGLTLAHLDGRPVDLVVADVSFISLTLLVEPLAAVLASSGDLLVLVKPQFEVGRARVGKGGVVRSPALHREAVVAVLEAAEPAGWHARRVVRSRLPGPAGNVEFFAWLTAEPGMALDDPTGLAAAEAAS